MQEKPIAFSNPAANTIRGALGFALYAVNREVYKLLYEPDAAGRNGLNNPPRPFLLRARELNDRVVLPGETFSIALHLFVDDSSIASVVQQGVQHMATEGFGPARSRCELFFLQTEQKVLSFEETEVDISKIRVHFISPTELKGNGQLVTEPDFSLLFNRIYSRINTLQSLYAAAKLPDGLSGLIERAKRIKRLTSDIEHVNLSRLSSRTGQEHPLGGFVGSTTYAGVMAEFLPYLRIAEWIGVGRQTTWGKGEITVEIF